MLLRKRIPPRFCGMGGSALVVERAPTVCSRRVLLDRDSQHKGSPTGLPTDTASAIEHSSLFPGFCAMVFYAVRNEYKERPCVWRSTSDRWATVSSDDMLTEVPINHQVALLDVSGGQTYIVCDTGNRLLMCPPSSRDFLGPLTNQGSVSIWRVRHCLSKTFSRSTLSM